MNELAFPFALLAFLGVSALPSQDLLEARAGFETAIVSERTESEPLEEPPADEFVIVSYPTPFGEASAYQTPLPQSDAKVPAIIWLTGGFPTGGGGSHLWEDFNPTNEQSARAYRDAGIAMLFASTRGTSGNPGVQEGFFGEVDDVLAAATYLRTLDGIDPDRIFLGGHSTGGTLALLVATASDTFRGVICFGPTDDPANYGRDQILYDAKNEQERALRAPIHHLNAISTPTFVIEGGRSSLTNAMNRLREASNNKRIEYLTIEGAGHFDVLDPCNRRIAEAILELQPKQKLRLSEKALRAAFELERKNLREADDLISLAWARRDMVDLDSPTTISYFLYAWDETDLRDAIESAEQASFLAENIQSKTDRDGDRYWYTYLQKDLKLKDTKAVFRASESVQKIATQHDLEFEGWSL